MTSPTAKTETRRQIRKTKMGNKRKNAVRRTGTTPTLFALNKPVTAGTASATTAKKAPVAKKAAEGTTAEAAPKKTAAPKKAAAPKEAKAAAPKAAKAPAAKKG